MLIVDYTLARDPNAAARIRMELSAALRLIEDHPRSGRDVGRGLRRLTVPRLPYLIIYKIDEKADAVAIATIRHTARRPITG